MYKVSKWILLGFVREYMRSISKPFTGEGTRAEIKLQK